MRDLHDLVEIPFIKGAVLTRCWEAEGLYDAYQFVLRCKGRVERITIELHERQELRDWFANTGPMQPGAGPRIYRDAYIDGLREALDLISMMNQKEKPWSRDA